MGSASSPSERLGSLGSSILRSGDVDVGIASKDAGELFFIHRVEIEKCRYETRLVCFEKYYYFFLNAMEFLESAINVLVAVYIEYYIMFS